MWARGCCPENLVGYTFIIKGKVGRGRRPSASSFFFFFFNLSIIYFWLRWVFVAVRGLSLVAASGGYSLSWCAGFSLRWLLLLRSTGSRRAGFSSCGTWASVVVARGL